MYKVLKVSEDRVSMGDTETKSLKIVNRVDCYEGISVGDHVELFQNDQETIVTKISDSVVKPTKPFVESKETSFITIGKTTLQRKKLISVALVAVGLAFLLSLFVENPKSYDNDFAKIIQYLKDEEGDKIVASKKDFTFYSLPSYLVEKNIPYKTFALGEVTVSNSPYYDDNTVLGLMCVIDNDDDVYCNVEETGE